MHRVRISGLSDRPPLSTQVSARRIHHPVALVGAALLEPDTYEVDFCIGQMLAAFSTSDRVYFTHYILAYRRRGRRKRKRIVCTLYSTKAYAAPASSSFQVRPSLFSAVPELLLKISSADGASSAASIKLQAYCRV